MAATVDRQPTSRQRERDVVRTLRRRLNRFEVRYEVRSQDVEAELAAGRLRETAEIAQWVVLWSAYTRLRPHRVDQPTKGRRVKSGHVREKVAGGASGLHLKPVDFWVDRAVTELIEESQAGPVGDVADLHLAGVSDAEWEAFYKALNVGE